MIPLMKKIRTQKIVSFRTLSYLKTVTAEKCMK